MSGSDMRLLSVVIPNYNYDRYLGAAVESALGLDWPDVEVIVVDDGSTDDSLAVLAAFGSRITVIAQENSGPRAACNRGFAASHGDVVIFLDSDDVLDPSVAREVAGVWRPGISKVQVQMQRIDREGRIAGRVFPNFRGTPTPDQIRRWMTVTAAYPTPPGSGNVYARTFLERLFPLDGRCGDATDSACLAAAPYLGDVVTIPRPLVLYRVHGANRSGLLQDPHRFRRQIVRAHQRSEFAREISGRDVAGGPRALRRDRHLLQMRAAERRVCAGEPPLLSDSRRRIFRDALVGPFAPGPESVGQRLAMTTWCLATLLAPSSIALRLVRWRFR